MDTEDGMRSTGIAGTCPHMCPLSEIERRLRIEDVAMFERPDPNVASTDTSLAVKRFARNVSALQGYLHIMPHFKFVDCMVLSSPAPTCVCSPALAGFSTVKTWPHSRDQMPRWPPQIPPRLERPGMTHFARDESLWNASALGIQACISRHPRTQVPGHYRLMTNAGPPILPGYKQI